ncbi:elongator complex protein [Salix suchowensis]|nr:elongator complex protein [Salix suchowensis]
MAASLCRTLRDGSLEESNHQLSQSKTPQLRLLVSTFSLSSPLSFCFQIPVSRCIVIVAFSRSPSFYILDCYSDPLDWKDLHMTSGNFTDVSYEASLSMNCVCKNVKDLDKLYSLILELGKGKKCFSVAIDSTSTSTIAGLLSNLRSHEQIYSGFWLLHSDLHEVKVTSILEYLSSMVASKGLGNLSLLEQNFGKGKLQVRLSAKMGLLPLIITSVLSEDELFNLINQGHLPKVQFNLDLSEEERIGRAKVVLPCEHQGISFKGKTEATLGSIGDSQKTEDSGVGEIIYFRDSDDDLDI